MIIVLSITSFMVGKVRFYQTREGVIVWAEISGLPHSELPCHEQILGFHIHTGTECGGITRESVNSSLLKLFCYQNMQRRDG